MKPVATMFAAMVGAAATIAIAQTQQPAPPQAPAKAQAQPQPAAQAQGAGGVQQCIACHGERGEGNAQGGFPRIAGQSQSYLLHQLESYANGSRRNPVMEPIAKGLSSEARAAAAAHYARMHPAPAADAQRADLQGGDAQRAAAQKATPANERGEMLAMRGDDARQVQGCANCHGPGGIGEPPGIPYIAGLDAAYLTAALNAFKNGSRRNDAGAQMRSVARGLSADDIKAVSQYFAALAPPARPVPENIVRAPSAGGPSSAASGARRGTTGSSTGSTQQPASGAGGAVGSEQGAGTSGGSQTPGGSDQSSATNKPAPGKSQ